MLMEATALRAVTIGDAAVGKTCIVKRFIHDHFHPSERSTVGAFYDSWRQYDHGREVEVQIWDTAGQEQYRSIIPVYFRFAAAAIFVYDVTNPASFESLDRWFASFQQHNHGKVSLFLVANKIDLTKHRWITSDDGVDWASAYHETSARTGNGVKQLFIDVSTVLLEQIAAHTSHTETPTQAARRRRKGAAAGCCGRMLPR
jgi:Ras-related protein Rab-6A